LLNLNYLMHGACFVWSSVSRSLLLAAAGEIPTLVDEAILAPVNTLCTVRQHRRGHREQPVRMLRWRRGRMAGFGAGCGAAIMTQRAARSAPDPAGHVWGALRAQSCYVLSPSP
jgi:hypothetical protein